MAIKVAESFTTTHDLAKIALHENCRLRKFSAADRDMPRITVDVTRHAQPILGFGGMFNDAAIYHFMRMHQAARAAALRSLFDPVSGAGWNLMRISFGSTDWDRNWDFYTYDDMPKGQRDDGRLSHFSIQKDIRRGHLQIIRQAMAINPELKIFAAVWGPPAWLKDNDQLITDGTIPPGNYRLYAKYLCKCVRAYEEAGIPILSVSPQNEPLCNDGRKTPQALWMDWKPMRDFLLVMGDEFSRGKIKAQIWAHDHNFCYTKQWVLPLVSDKRVRTVIDAVAWHDYEGDPAEMGALAKKFPGLPMYHTERALYTVEGMARIIALFRNGARSHNHWTTIQDEYGAPHQYSGGSEKTLEPIPEQKLPALIAPRRCPNRWRRTSGYYISAQLTRFVKRGALCLVSTATEAAPAHVAFRNPDGTIVIIMANTERLSKRFTIGVGTTAIGCNIPPLAVKTLILW